MTDTTRNRRRPAGWPIVAVILFALLMLSQFYDVRVVELGGAQTVAPGPIDTSTTSSTTTTTTTTVPATTIPVTVPATATPVVIAEVLEQPVAIADPATVTTTTPAPATTAAPASSSPAATSAPLPCVTRAKPAAGDDWATFADRLDVLTADLKAANPGAPYPVLDVSYCIPAGPDGRQPSTANRPAPKPADAAAATAPKRTSTTQATRAVPPSTAPPITDTTGGSRTRPAPATSTTAARATTTIAKECESC